jgi:hypothetical protein
VRPEGARCGVVWLLDDPAQVAVRPTSSSAYRAMRSGAMFCRSQACAPNAGRLSLLAQHTQHLDGQYCRVQDQERVIADETGRSKQSVGGA